MRHAKLKTQAFMAEDLWVNLNKKLLWQWWLKWKYGPREKLASRMFIELFYKILLDIIENNVTFVLPLKFGKYAEICMGEISGEEFKDLYKNNKLKGVDYVLSEFKCYTPVLKIKKRGGGMRTIKIFLDDDTQGIIDKYVNEGRRYY